MEKIAVIGDGGWGTTLAIMLERKKFAVSLGGVFPGYVAEMKKTRKNRKFLPGIKIPVRIALSSDLGEVIAGARTIVLAVPSQHLRSVLGRVKSPDLAGVLVVSVSKGIENGTNLRMSEIIRRVWKAPRVGVLSGPSISYEVARGVPTTVVAASQKEAVAREIQETFMSERFRVYTNNDVAGVELGGALKNIIAVAAGISDGLGFGANTKAALLCRGLAEIKRLGVKLGARPGTFDGISGMGDMVTTCISRHGRNRWLGEQIGKGRKLKDILAETEMVFEGVGTTRSAYDLSRKSGVEMPITAQIHAVLYRSKDPLKAVRELMLRKAKGEWE